MTITTTTMSMARPPIAGITTDHHYDEAEQPRNQDHLLMDRDTRNAAIAAAIILLVFGFAAYFLPAMMLAAGKVSTVLAAIIAVIFMVGLFVVLWLRGRSQRKKGL
jgi:cation transporter-like permease